MTRDLRHRDGLRPGDEKFLSQIETYGWNVTKIFRRQGETGPEWAFSTGLFQSYQHPEIVILGLPLDTMQEIINNIGLEVKKGARFELEQEYQGIFARCGCRFRAVDQSQYKPYLGWALWFYESDPFPVLQCFWPDKEGKYPWEAGCSESVISSQPSLERLATAL